MYLSHIIHILYMYYCGMKWIIQMAPILMMPKGWRNNVQVFLYWPLQWSESLIHIFCGSGTWHDTFSFDGFYTPFKQINYCFRWFDDSNGIVDKLMCTFQHKASNFQGKYINIKITLNIFLGQSILASWKLMYILRGYPDLFRNITNTNWRLNVLNICKNKRLFLNYILFTIKVIKLQNFFFSMIITLFATWIYSR